MVSLFWRLSVPLFLWNALNIKLNCFLQVWMMIQNINNFLLAGFVSYDFWSILSSSALKYFQWDSCVMLQDLLIPQKNVSKWRGFFIFTIWISLSQNMIREGLLTTKNIPLLDCLGNTADMNPFENLWELMTKEFAKMVINRT